MSSRGMALTRHADGEVVGDFFQPDMNPLPGQLKTEPGPEGCRAAAVANSAVASTTADAIRAILYLVAMLPSCKRGAKSMIGIAVAR